MIFASAIGAALPSACARADANGGARAADEVLEEIVVFGRARQQLGEAGAASEGTVGYDDIRLPPMLRVGELVEAVPGMVATQHSGTGKANQYFVRGFNLDHGTDFAVSVEGMPINMRTHGHGQGYLDLNFMIPELVETTTFRKGPYRAAVGDFSSAASVDFAYYDRLPDAVLSVSAGEYEYLRALAAGSIAAGDGDLTAAADWTAYDGAWDVPENLGQFKAYLAYASELAGHPFRLTAQAYDSRWDATDQVPARAVNDGRIDALGSIDTDLGGETSRYALGGRIDMGRHRLHAYRVDYELSLFSNFTYFLDDAMNGDEFEQRDRRTVYGLGYRGTYDAAGPAWRWGAALRFDDIDEVGLYPTIAREREGVTRQDAVEELSLDAWLEAEFAVTDALRVIAGLRGDYYDWDVRAFQPPNSGSGDDFLLSPKLSAAWRVGAEAEVYLNWGQGFHSNDVRGATIAIDPATGEPVEPVDVLVGSDGAELGLRYERGESFNASVDVFWLELDSELVYVGDAGTTEPNDATRRTGVEASAFWRATDWFAVNGAYTATRARFEEDQGAGTRIPGAVESTATLGAIAAWTSGWRATVRVRWLSEAPLIEDNSVRSDDSLLVNAGVGFRAGRWEYELDVFNLLDSDDHDISYYYASRLPGEPADGIEDIHFHPLEPRSARVSVTYRW